LGICSMKGGKDLRLPELVVVLRELLGHRITESRNNKRSARSQGRHGVTCRRCTGLWLPCEIWWNVMPSQAHGCMLNRQGIAPCVACTSWKGRLHLGRKVTCKQRNYPTLSIYIQLHTPDTHNNLQHFVCLYHLHVIFLVNLDDFFVMICTSFHEGCRFHQICSHSNANSFDTTLPPKFPTYYLRPKIYVV
jgi:hypothetical protein